LKRTTRNPRTRRRKLQRKADPKYKTIQKKNFFRTPSGLAPLAKEQQEYHRWKTSFLVLGC
jgi:hypothetical protein